MQQPPDSPEEPRPGTIVVLVPADLADELLEPLTEHFRDDPSIIALVDRRSDRRRSGIDRRMLRLPVAGENRGSGRERRQRSDRRAPLLPRDLGPTLPPELAEHASSLRWVQRLDPVSPQHAALPTQALVEAFAAGHHACATELYWRCYERIYQSLCQHMGTLAADAHTKRAFGRVLDRLPGFDPHRHRRRTGATPFDVFLAEVVEEYAAEMAANPLTGR
jgi:hypothetical protein